MDSIFEQIDKEVPQDDSTAIEEKEILMASIAAKTPKHLIETGTHRGKTTLYLLFAMGDVGFLNTADPYDWGQDGNFRKFPELEKKVKYHRMRGSEMIATCTDGIDWAFIDGYHEKEEVLEEMNVLLPKLADGAVVFFHDTHTGNEPHCDVRGAIKDLGLKVEYLKTQNGMAKYVHELR